jgi:hypothetical protein
LPHLPSLAVTGFPPPPHAVRPSSPVTTAATARVLFLPPLLPPSPPHCRRRSPGAARLTGNLATGKNAGGGASPLPRSH